MRHVHLREENRSHVPCDFWESLGYLHEKSLRPSRLIRFPLLLLDLVRKLNRVKDVTVGEQSAQVSEEALTHTTGRYMYLQ